MEEYESTENAPSLGLIKVTWILKLPLILLVLGSLIASFYAAYNKIEGITFSVFWIFSIIVILFMIGWVWRKNL